MYKQAHVLLVEDDPAAQSMVVHLVEYVGAQITVVANAEAAERLLLDDNTHFDLAIFDLHLPGKDGFSLLHDVHHHRPDLRKLHCWAWTAFHSNDTRYLALNAGFAQYFSKPLDVEAFTDALRNLLALED